MYRAYSPLLIGLLFSAQHLGAQAFSELDINELRVRVYANGLIGPDLVNGTSAFTVPGANNIPLLYSSGLWMGGMSPDNQLKMAAHMYNTPPQVSFWPGPLTITGDASITPDVSAQYDQVWNVTAAEVATHLMWIDCMVTPGCDPDVLFPGGYSVPPDFLTWPAMGDFSAGQSVYLAPFNDYNGDGAYNPMDGDTPCIFGDQALYCIFNDKLPSGMGQPIGVESHMMVFAYDDDPALANTVFVFYKSINQSTQTLENFYYGNFADLEVGCGLDDIVGTDAPRGLVYALNGDAVDEACPDAPGAGAQPPAFGTVVLKGPYLDADGIDNSPVLVEHYQYGTGFADGVVDNEGHGLSRSMYWSADGNPSMTDPEQPAHFYNYLRSIWKDNVPVTYGGDGYLSSSTASDYVFPGTSDADGLGTDGVPQPSWTETGAGNTPGDRRIVASSGPFTLDPGEHSNLLYAYVYAPDGTLEALQSRVDSIRAFANDLPGLFDGMIESWPGCNAMTVGINRPRAENAPLFTLMPNPANDEVVVRSPEIAAGALLDVFDMKGGWVLSTRTHGSNTPIDIRSFPNGIYSVRLVSGNSNSVLRLVKD